MTKILKNTDLLSMSIKTLEEELLFYKKSLFDVRFNLALNEKKDVSSFKKFKKSIARIKTQINKIKSK
jgi:ribosomal protein L29